MSDTRGELEVETLLKIVLGLVAILLALQIVDIFVSWIARLLTPLLLLVVALIVALWLLDRL
ncbi:hypothetical protein RBH26_10645 [Natronolimnohabitans sp. A-GB9]|uniref:DUF7554 family protein n=1 Tax=Natronolimnohabitans sp. A-GB9 TaxID=3069757 RepID=UPI0027B3E021|nr:hypothetical protein [Natronolimnohabitans sp. A-GB9]MDQ2050939.1 hypothetical protein [Natronolimnohabitans sp. A-GB9]